MPPITDDVGIRISEQEQTHMLKCMLAMASNLLTPIIPGTVTLPQSYFDLTAEGKQQYIWNEMILATQYSKLPALLSLNPKQIIGSLVGLSDLRPSFDHQSDVIAVGRRKFIHSFGSVAKVEFTGNPQSQFSGLFLAAEVPGLARISMAAPTAIAGNTPGMALKLFLPKSVPSANLLVMNSVNGQGGNTNPFARSFSNLIPEPEGVIAALALRFNIMVKEPNRLSVSQLAAVNADGSSATRPKTPYQIIFIPSKVEPLIKTDSANDFRVDLATIPVGTKLYDIFAKAFPSSTLKRVGSLTTTSEFVASAFGDEHLFFQHATDNRRKFGF